MPRHVTLLGLACLLAAALPTALGHGFMYYPAARNVVLNSDYCPHCLSAGGPWEVSGHGSLVWPAGVHGLCGDPAGNPRHEQPGMPQAAFTEGGDITISLLITAQHGGRHQFRLCPSPVANEGCFAANVLQRADGGGPYLWTPLQADQSKMGSAYGYSGEIYTLTYRLPPGVSCAHCTLQWEWTTGNSCNVPGSPWGTSMSPCDSPGPYPEEFWNCADITINPAAGPVAPTNPTPAVDPTLPPVNPSPAVDPTLPPVNPTPTVDPTLPPVNPTPAVDPTLPPVNPAPAVDPTLPPVNPAPAIDANRKLNPGGVPCGDPACFCQGTPDGLYTNPWSCSQYISCAGGQGFAMPCAPGTLWDGAMCNFESVVDCGGRPR